MSHNDANAVWLPFFPKVLVKGCNLDRSEMLFADEIQALLEHASYCRRIAAGTAQREAAPKLRDLAADYECRAQVLDQSRNFSKRPN